MIVMIIIVLGDVELSSVIPSLENASMTVTDRSIQGHYFNFYFFNNNDFYVASSFSSLDQTFNTPSGSLSRNRMPSPHYWPYTSIGGSNIFTHF